MRSEATAEIELRAGDASAVVDPVRGGVLASLRVRGADLLLPPTPDWQPYPRWGSFVMAPWVGPLSYGRMIVRGETFDLPPNEGPHAVHGLVSGVPWEVENATDSEASLVRSLGGLWPGGGEVRQQIQLSPDRIDLTIEVRSTGLMMPVAVGWHPWFSRGSGGVSVQVAAERHLTHEGPLPTGNVEPIVAEIDLREGPALGDRRIDAVYLGVRAPARLRTSDVDLAIESDPESDVMVVYTPAEAVCIEPWSAWPDAHRFHQAGRQTGLALVEPGETFRRWTRWSWSGSRTRSA